MVYIFLHIFKMWKTLRCTLQSEREVPPYAVEVVNPCGQGLHIPALSVSL